jgi:transcription termination/antitermination protein NusG
MNAVSNPTARVLQWYAVRMVPAGNGHRRNATLGAEFETYRTQSGRMAKRSVKGTGKRVFVPEHILKRAGFDVFLPVKKVWQRRNRYKSEKQLVAYPLLADWMFVGWPVDECRWTELMSSNVVAGVLGAGGRPVSVSGQTIQKLMRRWGSGVMPKQVIKAQDVLADVLPGETLRIATGPFTGFDALIVDVQGRGARAMVNLFGGKTRVQVALDDLVRPDDHSADGETVIPFPLFKADRPCQRCGGAMVQNTNSINSYHVRCQECGGVGALQSPSPDLALERWNSGSVGVPSTQFMEKDC